MKEHKYWPELKQVKDFAVVTMVKNDFFYLDIWIKHYQKNINPTFYILDHSSDTPIKNWIQDNYPDIDVNVIEIPAVAFDDRFKSAALSSISNMLQSCYKVVITSDVDEIILPVDDSNSLSELLLTSENKYTAPVGVEFVQNEKKESSYDSSVDLLEQREVFFFTSGYSKPVIWKGPAFFSAGLHGLDQEYNHTNKILLAHLRSVDVEQCKIRQNGRKDIELSSQQIASGSGLHWMRSIDEKSWYGNWIFNKASVDGLIKRTEDDVDNFIRELSVEKNGEFYKHNISLISDLKIW